MFDRGLIEETERLIERYGHDCRPLTSLGYAEASAVLRNELTREEAVAQAQQGHRNYAKRQLTWFRREPDMHWLPGCGGDEDVLVQARELVGAASQWPVDLRVFIPIFCIPFSAVWRTVDLTGNEVSH